MSATAILGPVLALVGWTLLVLLQIPFRRFRAAFAGQVTVDDFRVGESARVPEEVSIANRNFMNLLEAPLLFYVACLVLFVTQRVEFAAVALAWVYVGLRVLHSLIHLSYNRVLVRLAAFALSNVVLVAIWVMAAMVVFA